MYNGGAFLNPPYHDFKKIHPKCSGFPEVIKTAGQVEEEPGQDAKLRC